MAALIDSSVLIAAERGRLDLDSLLGRFADEPIGLAAITASELLHGVHRANTAVRRRRRAAFVEQLLAELPFYPFDVVTARTHASLRILRAVTTFLGTAPS